jgi:hypothetical protein
MKADFNQAIQRLLSDLRSIAYLKERIRYYEEDADWTQAVIESGRIPPPGFDKDGNRVFPAKIRRKVKS